MSEHTRVDVDDPVPSDEVPGPEDEPQPGGPTPEDLTDPTTGREGDDPAVDPERIGKEGDA